MLNYRHSINTINKTLKAAKKNETIEYAYSEAGKTVYRMLEPADTKNNVRECGIYYSKSDIVEAVNHILK